jgi:hypothetical protein
MRWPEDSDFSDSNYDTTPPPSFAEVVCQSSPTREPSPTANAVAAELPVETLGGSAEDAPKGRKRHQRRRTRRCGHPQGEGARGTAGHCVAARVPTHQRLGKRISSGSSDEGHILVHQWLGNRVAGSHGVASRVPAHQRLGERAPPWRRRRISPPDAAGWREVLPRQAPPPRDARASRSGGTAAAES